MVSIEITKIAHAPYRSIVSRRGVGCLGKLGRELLLGVWLGVCLRVGFMIQDNRKELRVRSIFLDVFIIAENLVKHLRPVSLV